MTYHWDWLIFWQPSPDGAGTYLDMLLSGLWVTVLTAILSWVLAILAGTLVGVARSFPGGLIGFVATASVEVFRNVPLLVQLFLWYFVLPELLPSSWGLWIKQLPGSSFYTAIVGLGFYTSARIAEQVRAGIGSLPRGQRMASTALGLTVAQTYRHVLLPMAFRIIWPPLTSEFLACIKNTSVALTIGLLEMTARTRAMAEFSFQVFEAFTAATLLYLGINIVVAFGMRIAERRLEVPGYSAEH